MCGSHRARCSILSIFVISVESECSKLCCKGSIDRFEFVNGELTAVLRRLLLDIVSVELVPGICEVRTLLKPWSQRVVVASQWWSCSCGLSGAASSGHESVNENTNLHCGEKSGA